MGKEYELKFKKNNKNLTVEVTNFKDKKKMDNFVKSVRVDWA